MQPDVVRIAPIRHDLGESLHWDARAGILYWIDAWKAAVHAYEPVTGDTRQTDFASALGGRPIGSTKPHAKKSLTLRLDPDVIEGWRASGPG